MGKEQNKSSPRQKQVTASIIIADGVVIVVGIIQDAKRQEIAKTTEFTILWFSSYIDV